MEHVITIKESGAVTAYPIYMTGAALDYVASLVHQNIAFTYEVRN
jgi:hypothetical protein